MGPRGSRRERGSLGGGGESFDGKKSVKKKGIEEFGVEKRSWGGCHDG